MIVRLRLLWIVHDQKRTFSLVFRAYIKCDTVRTSNLRKQINIVIKAGDYVAIDSKYKHVIVTLPVRMRFRAPYARFERYSTSEDRDR